MMEYKHLEYSLGFKYSPDFNDIREVAKYLKMKSLIKKSGLKMLENLYGKPSNPNLPAFY